MAILAGTGGRLAPDLASRGVTLVFVGPDAADIGQAVAAARSAGAVAAGFVGDPGEDSVRHGVVELALELFGRVDLVGAGGGGAEALVELAAVVARVAGCPVEIVLSGGQAPDSVLPG